MLNEIINGINNAKTGNSISFSIPLGDDSINIFGKTSIDSDGNVIVKKDSLNIGALSIDNCTLKIDRTKSLSYNDGINIHIEGTGKYGQTTEAVKDLKINLNNNRVTISGAPFGINFDTYEILKNLGCVLKDELGNEINLADAITTQSGTNYISSSGGGGGGAGRRSIGQRITDDVSAADNSEVVNEISQFTASNHSDYWKNEYQSILDNTSSVNYDTLAQQLKSDVDFISKDFSKVKDQMTQWAGAASGAAKEAMDTILSKFQCTMDNINDNIGPACSRLENFKEKLERLKRGKEELTGADGNGGLDKELEDLTKDYENKESEYNTLKRNEPSLNNQVTTSEGQTRAHDTWKTNVANAKAAMDEAKEKVLEKQSQIKAKEEELNTLLQEVNETYSMIQELVKSVKSFKEYFGNGSKANLISSSANFANNYEKILNDLNSFSFGSTGDYTKKSPAVLADESFFQKLCNAHSQDGWKIENGVLKMTVDGKNCTYDINKHMFSDGGNTKLESYFYLPSDIVNSNDLSQLRNLNTYTFFTTKQNMYVNAIDNEEINTITMKVVKQDPLQSKYGTVASLTKMTNTLANTDLTKCENVIGGDSVYGAHSLKIAASTGNLYNTVYCIDNAAIVTGVNGQAGTKEQFSSLEDLKGLDGKNIYFINTSGDDNYAKCADMSMRGNAYVSVSNNGNISVEQVKNSFTYTGIEIVAQNCPNAKVHIVYQDQDTARNYQRTNFPIALDELASKYGNVWNDSKKWDEYISKKYKTHSEGNYIAADLASAEMTNNPNYDNNYRIGA